MVGEAPGDMNHKNTPLKSAGEDLNIARNRAANFRQPGGPGMPPHCASEAPGSIGALPPPGVPRLHCGLSTARTGGDSQDKGKWVVALPTIVLADE